MQCNGNRFAAEGEAMGCFTSSGRGLPPAKHLRQIQARPYGPGVACVLERGALQESRISERAFVGAVHLQ